MKHVIAIFIALFSLTFLVGASCDSGDFTTSYFYCCTDNDTNCTTDPTQCPAGGCSTGQQSFTNGQFECSTLQTDAANNNCALTERFFWYFTIGCTGTFTENPSLPPPTGLTAVAGAPTTIQLTWVAPVGLTTAVTYTIFRGTSSGTEVTLIGNVSGNSYLDQALATGTVYYYTVAAANIAGNGSPSIEAFATAP